MEKRILATPLGRVDLEDLRTGDIVYLSGNVVTCRDMAHRRVVEKKQALPVDIRGGAIIHAGPIVREGARDHFEMVAIGPTTSMRMEKFEKEFIRETGVRLIIGKGGMGEKTAQGCREYGAVHAVYPAGCAVLAATQVEAVADVRWRELGMPEALWVLKVKEFGPLIISIDARGNNLFEENKKIFNERKEKALREIYPLVGTGFF